MEYKDYYQTLGVSRDADNTTAVAARRTGLSPRTVRRYIRRGLIGETLTEAELARLRRVRRLGELGVNLAGIQVILHMRRRMQELRAKLVEANRMGH